MNEDKYGEILNGEKTFKEIARLLKEHGSSMIGWTDEAGTHLDILFTHRPNYWGTIQRGIRPYEDVIVSIMGVGAFGFEIKKEETATEYFNQRFNNFFGQSVTVEKFAELVNQVKKQLIELDEDTQENEQCETCGGDGYIEEMGDGDNFECDVIGHKDCPECNQ